MLHIRCKPSRCKVQDRKEGLLTTAVPLPGTALLVVFALAGAWISDGPLRGRRWPIIYFGAIIMLACAIVLKTLPLYTNITAHFAVYWLIGPGVSTNASQRPICYLFPWTMIQ